MVAATPHDYAISCRRTRRQIRRSPTMRAFFFAVIAFAILLAGCGGGGGAPSGPFTYITDWSASTKAPDGLSQIVQLLDGGNKIVDQSTITKPTSSATFPNVP